MKSNRVFTISEILRVATSESRTESFKQDYLTSEESEDEGPLSMKNFISLEGRSTYLTKLLERQVYLTKEGRSALCKKWRKRDETWGRFQLKAWKLITNANAEISRNEKYYEELCKSFEKTLSSTQKLIQLDIRRTHSKKMTKEKEEMMFRILFSIAKRRMDMGYCQGMNFLCIFFIDCGFSEVEVFWILVHIFENINNPFYYKDLQPALVDIKIFRLMITLADPELTKFMVKKEIDLNAILLPFFITFYTTSSNFNLKKIIMDHVLFEGVTGFFKVLLVFFELLRSDLMKTRDMVEFKLCFDSKLNSFSNFSSLESRLSGKFIHRCVFLKARELMMNKAIKENKNSSNFLEEVHRCIPGFPSCFSNETPSAEIDLPQVHRTEKILNNLKPNHFSSNEIFNIEPRKTKITEDFAIGFNEDRYKLEYTAFQITRSSPSVQSEQKVLQTPSISDSNFSESLSSRSGQISPHLSVRSEKKLFDEELELNNFMPPEFNLILFRRSHKCLLSSHDTEDKQEMKQFKNKFFLEAAKNPDNIISNQAKLIKFERIKIKESNKPNESQIKRFRDAFKNRNSAQNYNMTSIRKSKSFDWYKKRIDIKDSQDSLLLSRNNSRQWTIEIDVEDCFINQRIPEGIDQLLFEKLTQE